MGTARSAAIEREQAFLAAATIPVHDMCDTLLGALGLGDELDFFDAVEKFLIGAAVRCSWLEDVEVELYRGDDTYLVSTGELKEVTVVGTIVGFSDPDYRGRYELIVEPGYPGGRRRIDEDHFDDMLVGFVGPAKR